jgi:hypothetical protein
MELNNMDINNIKSRQTRIWELAASLKDETIVLLLEILNSGKVDLTKLEGYNINSFQRIKHLNDIEEGSVYVVDDSDMSYSTSFESFDQEELKDLINFIVFNFLK